LHLQHHHQQQLLLLQMVQMLHVLLSAFHLQLLLLQH
jgi:hypothetical protein